jgi:uncharacterized membrane protein
MEKRIFFLDNLRGIAFILMVIHHIFYLYDVNNNYNTSFAKNPLVDTSGTIARTLFILLSGVSIYMSYKANKTKRNDIKKRAKRSFEISMHALIISVVSFIYYPEYFIRFGVLHFLALGTFLVSFLAPYKKLSIIALLISLIVKFPSINNTIDTITGASFNYRMMDWFPLNKWLPLLICGLIVGQHEDFSKIKLLNNKSILTFLGKNSLDLYTIHFLILIIFYKQTLVK